MEDIKFSNIKIDGIVINDTSMDVYKERAEKNQKMADMLSEYTEKLSGLTYPEWIALREEMNRLFNTEFDKARENATLKALKNVTGE